MTGSGRLCGGPPLPGQIFMRAKVFHASGTAASPILAGAKDNLASFFCIQGDICCYSGRMIAAISHPWSAGTLIPAEKPLFCPFSGRQIFYAAGMARRIFFICPPRPGSLFSLSRCIPASLRPSSPPRFKIRALGLSFRKKQDIIAVYLVKKESKGFLN